MNMLRGRLGGIADGLGLGCLGVFLAALASSQYYWYFLNPKYVLLTLLTGLVLTLVGGYMALRPSAHGGRASGRLATVVAILVMGILAFEAIERDEGASGFSLDAEFEEGLPETLPPRLELDGKTYVRMNVVEAAMLARENPQALPQQVAIRGQVVRLPGGEFAVGRVYVVCCLADAVGVALVVSGPAGMPESEEGWVEVAGRIVPLEGPVPDTGSASIPLAGFLVVHDEAMLLAEHILPSTMPDPPFIFEVRFEEPFAY